MKVPEIHWIPFDKKNPPIDLGIDVEVLIMLREDNYNNGATWRYSVDIATPYGNYIDNFWDTTNDWCEGQRVEVIAYAELPYSLSESKLKENSQMAINEYQENALRTTNKSLNLFEQLEDGLMGLNGESGECIDILKKHLFQGHDLDKEHLAKELGDVAWYLAVSAYSIGYDLETILRMNVDKLKERYPYGFDSANSINRKSNDI